MTCLQVQVGNYKVQTGVVEDYCTRFLFLNFSPGFHGNYPAHALICNPCKNSQVDFYLSAVLKTLHGRPVAQQNSFKTKHEIWLLIFIHADCHPLSVQ